jgi:hypothetical protein
MECAMPMELKHHARLRDLNPIHIPQLSFDYNFGKGIATREFLKTVQFNADILKGEYDATAFQLFPFIYKRK